MNILEDYKSKVNTNFSLNSKSHIEKIGNPNEFPMGLFLGGLFIIILFSINDVFWLIIGVFYILFWGVIMPLIKGGGVLPEAVLSANNEIKELHKNLEERSFSLNPKEKDDIMLVLNSFLVKLNHDSTHTINVKAIAENGDAPFTLSLKEVDYIYLPRGFLDKFYTNKLEFELMLAHEVGHIYQGDSKTISNKQLAVDSYLIFIIPAFAAFLIPVFWDIGVPLFIAAIISSFLLVKQQRYLSELNADFAAIVLTENPFGLMRLFNSYPSDSLEIKARKKNVEQILNKYYSNEETENLINTQKQSFSDEFILTLLPEKFKNEIEFEVDVKEMNDSELPTQAKLVLWEFDNDNQVMGYIRWMLIEDYNPIEVLRGRKVGNEFFLKGKSKYDVNNLIELDEYNLVVSDDRISGELVKCGGEVNGKRLFTG